MSQLLTLTYNSPLVVSSDGPSNTMMSILPTESDHIYRTGYNLTLSCSTLSSPAATIEWTVNGLALNKYGPWINLNSVTESNSGTYKCLFHNSITSRFGSASTMIQILGKIQFVVRWRIVGRLFDFDSDYLKEIAQS